MRTKYLLKQGKLRPVGKENKTEGSETNLPPSTVSLRREFVLRLQFQQLWGASSFQRNSSPSWRLLPWLLKPGCVSAPQSPRHLLVPWSTFPALSGCPCAPAAPGKLLQQLLQMSSPTQPPASLLLAPPGEHAVHLQKQRTRTVCSRPSHHGFKYSPWQSQGFYSFSRSF